MGGWRIFALFLVIRSSSQDRQDVYVLLSSHIFPTGSAKSNSHISVGAKLC